MVGLNVLLAEILSVLLLIGWGTLDENFYGRIQQKAPAALRHTFDEYDFIADGERNVLLPAIDAENMPTVVSEESI